MKAKKTIRGRAARRAKTAKPETPDDYLAGIVPDKRAALETLRKRIKDAAPEADECISYGVPAFRLNGRLLVAYAAAAHHCAFYPGSVVQALKDELNGYDISKGTVRFSADRVLPARLVRKLVKLRLARNSS